MSTRHGGDGGVIVNVSSIASRLGGSGQYVDYAASKAGIDLLTVGLAQEVVEEGIRVNTVRPGIIRTDIHASGGQPDRADRLATADPHAAPGGAGGDRGRDRLAVQPGGVLRHGCVARRERRSLTPSATKFGSGCCFLSSRRVIKYDNTTGIRVKRGAHLTTRETA